MTPLTSRLSIAACGLAVLALIACDRAPEGRAQVLEEISIAALRTETEAAAARVRSARADLASHPQRAASDLAAAEDALDRLLTYYLPLLEARERAYNAYRHYAAGNFRQTSRDLDEIERSLKAIAAGHGHLLREMQEPLERLEDARAALEVDRNEASEALRDLATRLNLLLVKGGLVLGD